MAEICPLHIVVASFAGWMNRRQGEVLDDLIEEKRVLKSQLKGRRPRLSEGSLATEHLHATERCA